MVPSHRVELCRGVFDAGGVGNRLHLRFGEHFVGDEAADDIACRGTRFGRRSALFAQRFDHLLMKFALLGEGPDCFIKRLGDAPTGNHAVKQPVSGGLGVFAPIEGFAHFLPEPFHRHNRSSDTHDAVFRRASK